MPASKYPLKIEQGATFNLRLTWTDPKNRAINLGGYSFRMQIRPTYESGILHTELSTSNGKIVMTPLKGILDFKITDEETATFNWTTGVYDLYAFAGNGDTYRMLEGSVKVSPGVTR